MLLEFRVRNYRSIRDEQVLSLVASVDKKLASTNVADTGLKAPGRVVRVAAVYGANASGKSNLLQALSFMRALVAESATVIQLGQTFNVQPFRLDTKVSTQPSEFEVTFVEEGVRYQYGFSLTPERIVDEWLLVYRARKPQKWFSRTTNTKTGVTTYDFSSHLTGPRKLWQDSTRPNALFLSTAAQLNSELLRPVFTSIVEKISHIPAGQSPLLEFTNKWLKDAAEKKSIRDFLLYADISISDIVAVPRKGIFQHITFSATGEPAKVSREEQEMLMPQFVHETKRGSARFELHEESMGTQRLYLLAGPVLEVLRNGRALIVDELDSSLHTLLVRRLIGMFQNPKLNPHGAQLIFSTHDTSLLDQTLFRRDQIWFTEKDSSQATKLYPLSDFSPRNKEALERGYLAGRYGAVPFFDGTEKAPVGEK